MASLIGNGANLYRRANSLVRTPIRITLRPSKYWNSPAGETETLVRGFSMITGAHRAYTGSDDILNANIDSQVEEIYAMKRVPANWWVTTVQDMGACWYGGGFSTTDPNITESGYLINWIARCFFAQGCYLFRIPDGLESLTLTSVSCTYSGSVAHSFGSTKNGQLGASSKTRQFCGFINSSLQISPSQIMSKLSSEGYDLSFMANTGSSFGVFDYWLFTNNIKQTGRDGTIPVAWMNGNADVTDRAISRIQSIMSSGGSDFYMHLVRPFNIGSSSFQPAYRVSTPLWWEAQIVRNPVFTMTFE